MDNPVAVIKEIKRVLKKGGYVMFLVPTDNKLFKFIWFMWTLYYPVWRHAHVQSFQNDKLENEIGKVGLKISSLKTFNLKLLKLIVSTKE